VDDPLQPTTYNFNFGGCPWTRYQAAGLVLKKNFVVQISDSSSGSPVSGATVQVGSINAKTDGSGKATLHVAVGPHSFSFSKKYYQNANTNLTVPILKESNTPTIKLVATGRQVKVSITNLITKKALSNTEIEVADVTAKTDASGNALLVVPANLSEAQATLSLSGYNDAKVNIKISNEVVQQNNFTMVPAGKVYFLSKLSGTIDIVKTNLDGSERSTITSGTGSEDNNNTVMLASRDWKYLALLAKRDSDLPKLYVINTADDKLLTMDEGNATFKPIGWYNHYFVYTVSRNGYNSWQPNATSVKSYNAETGQILTLVNSNASGSSNADAEYENIWDVLFFGNDVVYTRTWYKYPGYLQVNNKQDVLAAIRPDGANSRQLKAVDAASSYMSNLQLNKPDKLYFGVFTTNSTDTSYYSLDKNGIVAQTTDSAAQSLPSDAISYLESPSGSATFWQDERDGKNTLFVGDQNADNPTQIASLSDYSAYGWYSDDYLLVSKNGSELYVVPKTGIKSDSQAIKITDYHKPSQNYYGYGGGYGGL